jgi:hypothetical protein
MEKKKPTNAQLQKRLDRAIVLVDRTKETKEIFFSDRGLRLICNEDYAVVQTNYHKHVFTRWTTSGESKPYVYTGLVIDLAYQYNCILDDGKEKVYSFDKLLNTLKEDKNNTLGYLVVYYYSMWLFNIFNPLYMIGENESTSFMTYVNYVFNVASNALILKEHTEDMTNKQFLDELLKNMKEFTSGLGERVLFKKMTDEEFVQQEMNATNEMEQEKILENKLRQENESKD